MFKNKITSFFAALLLMASLGIATAAPASAHVTYCSKHVIKPLQSSINEKMIAGGKISCPADGHQASVTVTTWVEVYAPRWDRWGDGDWRRLSYKDFDSDHRIANAAVLCPKLYGPNKYRTRAEFTVSGDQGTREYDIKTDGVTFNRYMPRR